MADQNAPSSQNFGSAANLMAEALDKASQELDKTVRACVDQLQAFNEQLSKSLSSQLSKVVEQSKNFVESNVEDLTTHREELIDRLMEFERTEIETMVSAARDVRQQVSARAQQAGDSISKLVEEQVAELRALIEHPEGRFADFKQTNNRHLEEFTHTGRGQIGTVQADCEQKLTARAQELEQSVMAVVVESKKGIEESLERFNVDMEQKIAHVLHQLSDVVTQTLSELEESSQNSASNIDNFVESGTNRLSGHIDKWQEFCESHQSTFETTLAQDSKSAEKSHCSKLERKVNEVKDEINQIANDATAKITASHKLFFSSLRRLEKKYNDRLERLMNRFETALAEEAKINASGIALQNHHELRELLHARLEARRKEILKSFHRQVEQLESEYVRMSGGSHERLESIRTTTVESLDKQVRIMKSELERISRNFKNELVDLNSELPKIEEAGRAAALAVMAYRSAMLSFSSD